MLIERSINANLIVSFQQRARVNTNILPVIIHSTHYIFSDWTKAEMPTSGDLKSGDFFRTSTSSFPRPNSPMRSPAPRKCLFWFGPLPPHPHPPPIRLSPIWSNKEEILFFLFATNNMHHARKWSQKPKRAISTLNKRLLTYTVSTQWHRRTIKLAISYGEFVYGYSHHLQVTLCSKRCMWTSNSGGWS